MRYKIELKTMVLKLQEPTKEYEKASNAQAAFNISTAIFKQLDADQEHFVALFLNSQNLITGYKVISSGGQASSIVDMRILFRNALFFGAQNIIVVHNHPSGNGEPSPEDIEMTKQIRRAGKIMDITLLDHLVLFSDSFYSFRESTNIWEVE